jgi:diguanylate cyclase (GGDEF)-like protein/PAS domain S-box-containing protein
MIGLPRSVRSAWGACFAVLALSAPARADVLHTVAVLAFQNPGQTQARWQPTAAYLDERFPGHRFRIVAQSYDQMDADFSGEHPDFVLTQPSHYVALAQRYRLNRLVTVEGLGEGRAARQFGGVILASAGRGDINTLSDLKDRKIATSDRRSLGAYQAQAYELDKEGLNHGDLRLLTFGTQDKALAALVNGEADAAFVRSGVLEDAVAKGQLERLSLKVINPRQAAGFPHALSTDLYPEWPLAVMPSVADDFAKAVAIALLSMPAHHPAAASARYRAWAPPADYEPVRQMLEVLRLPPYDRGPEISVQDIGSQYGPAILLAVSGLALLFAALAVRLRSVVVEKNSLLVGIEAENRLLSGGVVAVIVRRLEPGWPLAFFSDNVVTVLGRLRSALSSDEFRFADIVHPDDLPNVSAEMARHLESHQQKWLQRYRILDAAGKIRWVLDFTMVERDEHGVATGLRGYLLDDTERAVAESRLSLLASVFTHAREGIVITDRHGVILDVNPQFSAITGYARDEVVGQNPKILRSGHHHSDFYHELWQTIGRKGTWQGKIFNRRKSGEVYPEMLSITAVREREEAPSHFIGVFTDITDQEARERELAFVAHHDPLTGLPNRVLMNDRLRMAMAQARRNGGLLAICYLDLDGFKPVNDTLGHEAGDRLLVAISRRLVEELRDADTVARLGGDEFVLILSGLETQDDCRATLDRLLQRVADPVLLPEASATLSASIGVTFFPSDDEDPDILLRHADQAMYQAKQGGRNRYHVFDMALDKAAASRHESLNRIREALQKCEFLLYYQPRVNMSSGEVEGVEALVRWQHPERGLLPPGEFLPQLAGTDIELELGKWVIAEALRQAERWRRTGTRINVSVNVAGAQVLSDEFVPQLREALGQYPEMPSGTLELEVLESSALSDIGVVSAKLHECRDFGVSVALDDFGTGYSSLAYLRRLPADVLKVDQSFVREMLDNPDDLAIVEGIIGLAHAFRRRVVAEGVESEAHGVALLHLGSESAQGYGIARPMPADSVAAWVATWRPPPGWVAAATLRLDRLHLPLLLMEVEHRHWMDRLIHHLHADRMLQSECPPLDAEECRFGRWYRNEGMARYGGLTEFVALAALHEAVHLLAAELTGWTRAGRQQAALERIPELQECGERLQLGVQELIATVALS